MTKFSNERRSAFDAIVKEGDFKHNTIVFEKGEGVLFPKYRSVEGAHAQFITCRYCKGLYGKDGVERHKKICKQKPK